MITFTFYSSEPTIQEFRNKSTHHQPWNKTSLHRVRAHCVDDDTADYELIGLQPDEKDNMVVVFRRIPKGR